MFRWLVTPIGGDESLTELTTARDRRVTWRLRDQSEAGLTLTSGGRQAPRRGAWGWGGSTGPIVPVDTPDQSQLITELRTDLIVADDDGRGIFRGRFGPSVNRIDEVSHEVEYGVIDYRGVLGRRNLHEAIDWPSVDQAEAGWWLIYTTQEDTGLAGGNLGISRGALPVIGDVAVEHPLGKSIAEAIDETSKRNPGFDWWIDADLAYQAGIRGGTLRDFALIQGTTVAATEITFDPAAYANTIIQTGAEGLTPEIVAVTNLGTPARIEGRWEAVEANPDITVQNALDDTAIDSLARRGVLPVAYKVRLKPGLWTPDDLWIGDLVRIVCRSGSKNVNAIERVTEITVTDGPDGTPEVDITVGNTLAADVAAMLRRLPDTLIKLARR